jgi:hypothetical protein
MANSTPRASSNAQNSSKSGARSNDVPPEELDGREALRRGTPTPLEEARVLRALPSVRGDAEDTAVQPEVHLDMVAQVPMGVAWTARGRREGW